MYTIGQVSKLFGLPVSTLRYYDKEGLFDNIHRDSGIRKFSDRDLERLRMIECLKKSGLEIKDIKQFMIWCGQGSGTFLQRRELFARQRRSVQAEIAHLEQVLAMLDYKCWFYDQAIRDGTDEHLRNLTAADIPEEYRAAYNLIHSGSEEPARKEA